jgi:hypothetical protein
VRKNCRNTKQKTVSSQTQTVSSQTQDSCNVIKPKQQAAKSSNFPYWFNVVADAFVRVIIKKIVSVGNLKLASNFLILVDIFFQIHC